MNEQIKKLLERVLVGELSEVEAEKKYLHLINSQAGKNKLSADSPMFDIEEKISLQNQVAYDDRKIECINKLDNPEYRLFIFLPFGFGNETLSWSWKNAFSQQGNLEVWLMGASDVADWGHLIDHLLKHMVQLCDAPFIVYGHSMGGIIAYETLVELERNHQLSPLVFIPSSVSPPEVFERLKVLPPVYEIDNDMSMQDCREILEKSQIILPLKSGVKPMPDEAIKCDLGLIKTYSHEHGKSALTCPLLALQANNDVLIKDPVGISLWKNYTKGYFHYQEVEGTHLYFMNPPQSLFKTIKSFLKKTDDIKRSQFQAKTYRLVSFETGTDEV
ncbi:thioesterase II family protein, partial [Methyloglobulus morosus]|uniref:thioesterase II family protein n=1 Tax=Methyloglobulus morosus TaxID=1410681 RepID=UPI00055B31C6